MAKMDERLARLSANLAVLSEKAAKAAEETKAARELREETIRDKISTAKGDVVALQERIRIAGEEKKSKLGSNLIKLQMTLEAKLQDKKEAHDKKLLERYIDDMYLHIADVYETIDYLISDAKLSILEVTAAVEEYNERFATAGTETEVQEEETAQTKQEGETAPADDKAEAE
ncbi:MAG: hypothetical protein IKE58_09210 [Blautia sp.]|nr:hypothetical protein [Blautia sp.]